MNDRKFDGLINCAACVPSNPALVREATPLKRGTPIDLSNLQPRRIAGARPDLLTNLERRERAKENVINARSVLGKRRDISPPQDDRVGGSPPSTSAAISAKFFNSSGFEPNGLRLSSLVRSGPRPKIARRENANAVHLQAKPKNSETEHGEMEWEQQQATKTVADNYSISRGNKPNSLSSGATPSKDKYSSVPQESLGYWTCMGIFCQSKPCDCSKLFADPDSILYHSEEDTQEKEPFPWPPIFSERKMDKPKTSRQAPTNADSSIRSYISGIGHPQSERAPSTRHKQVDGETPFLYMSYTISKDMTIDKETYEREKLLAVKSRPHVLPARIHTLPRGSTTSFNAPRPPFRTHTKSPHPDYTEA